MLVSSDKHYPVSLSPCLPAYAAYPSQEISAEELRGRDALVYITRNTLPPNFNLVMVDVTTDSLQTDR